MGFARHFFPPEAARRWIALDIPRLRNQSNRAKSMHYSLVLFYKHSNSTDSWHTVKSFSVHKWRLELLIWQVKPVPPTWTRFDGFQSITGFSLTFSASRLRIFRSNFKPLLSRFVWNPYCWNTVGEFDASRLSPCVNIFWQRMNWNVVSLVQSS